MSFETAAKKVFEQLDSDYDGKISATALDLTKIDISVLELIANVLYQMEDEGSVYDLQKFIDACTLEGI